MIETGKPRSICNVKVSVLVPVHGDAPFLGQAVNSVIGQEFEDWELLLVLDRPLRALEETASRLKMLDSRVRVVVSPGSGIVDALNFGLDISEGVLIARLDSDDVMESQRLELQVNTMESAPMLACVGSQMTLIDPDGSFLGKTRYPISTSQIRRHLRYQNCIGHPAVMFRKKLIVEVGGYRKALTGSEDYDLWLRLIKKHEVLNLDYALTKYRVSSSQYSKTFGDRHTLLEDLARLDAEYNFLGADAELVLPDEVLRRHISANGLRNVIKHPIKTKRNLPGHAVSKLIRIAEKKNKKTVKFIKILPWAGLLLLSSPLTFSQIAIDKLMSKGNGD
jgi:glycosyltransferase involved in cell wall biosynthesis